MIKAFRESDIYVSPEILLEYRETPVKLQKQGKITHQQMQALISGIATVVSQAKIVYSTEKLSLCRDPKDNMILECCHAAKTKILITGDKDLLDMEDLPFELHIMTSYAFLED